MADEDKEMITLCIADNCPNRGRHQQHSYLPSDPRLHTKKYSDGNARFEGSAVQYKEDYAVRAARGWLKARYDYEADHCSCCEADIAQLAAIIRKHAGPEIDGLSDKLDELNDEMRVRGEFDD